MKSNSPSFMKRAIYEARRYGEDPWVFLRELVQNSRDAAASSIEFSFQVQDQKQILICRDNGSGMSYADFDAYLLRLYASSKEEEDQAVGFFGVGFWSVLLFEPDVIQVSSHTAGKSEAFQIDCESFNIEPITPTRYDAGTDIILVRHLNQKEPNLADLIKERLIYYAGNVRANHSGQSLGLFFNGEQVNQELPVPSTCGRRISTSSFDGTIGFGSVPSVKIYKGGILVRDLSSLEEVIPSRETNLPFFASGLFPVIALNVDGLKILMDRQQVYEDQELHDAVTYCESLLAKLHHKMIGQLFPMDFRNNIYHLSSLFSLKKSLIILGFLLLFLISIFVGYTFRFDGTPGFSIPLPSTVAQHVDDLDHDWRGSFIDRKSQDQLRWHFEYRGPDHILFQARTLPLFDQSRGFFPVAHQIQAPYPQYEGDTQVWVRMKVRASDSLVLPIPQDYVLKTESVALGDLRLRVNLNQFGEPMVNPPKDGMLTYEAFPGFTPELPLPIPKNNISWPEPFKTTLQNVESKPVAEKVWVLGRLVESEFTYSRNKDVVDAFNLSEGSWTERLFLTGAGDCDVLNGLLVLLLQEADVPAWLTVGLVGYQGQIRSEMHAWLRYYDEKWVSIDVTGRQTISTFESYSPMATPGSIPNITIPPIENAPQSVPVAKSKTRLWPFLPLFILPLLTLLYFRKKKSQKEPPQQLAELFLHYLENPPHQDPYHMQFRPVFPLLSGDRRASLHQLELWAERGPIFASNKKNHVLKRIHSQAPILDSNSSILSALKHLFPFIVFLDELESFDLNSNQHPLLNEAQQKIRELEPRFLLIQVADFDRFREWDLPLKEGNTPVVMFGLAHPKSISCLKLYEREPQLAVFEMVRIIMEKTTFFLSDRDQFLQDYAQSLEVQCN